MSASIEKKQERVIYWYHILILSFVHLIFPWSLYILFSRQQFSLFAWVFVLSYSSGIGISVGSHRLWTHRAFKAKLPLRIFLAFLQTKAYQYSIFNWVRDHRMHHKFTDTDADPHNPNRGFFFRHIGWLFVKPHSQILAKRKDIDMSDVWADPVVYYQKKYYPPLAVFCAIIIPVSATYTLFSLSIIESFLIAFVAPFIFILHITLMINSLGHGSGERPYTLTTTATDMTLPLQFGMGDGDHNFHHAFPHDYCSSEWGWNWNVGAICIDLFRCIGQAYDLNRASKRDILTQKLLVLDQLEKLGVKT